ncbi:Irc21 protein [Maudiozyma humilis]|uniref:Irc21 protein n=1 Tax=Maudiozyma humilis TaxID=51915 RepID=A0AAV5S5I0_MAUHU|nr:hypothetical protein DAKH74_040200 [Kazachstania humilis]GMM58123.1 Irc21 protein [Kazachstania humilis]
MSETPLSLPKLTSPRDRLPHVSHTSHTPPAIRNTPSITHSHTPAHTHTHTHADVRFKVPAAQPARASVYAAPGAGAPGDAAHHAKVIHPATTGAAMGHGGGSSTMGRGGGLLGASLGGAPQRQKVRLAPGHSALDWNELNQAVQHDKQRSNELVTGLSALWEDPEQLEVLQRINADNADAVVKLRQFNIPCRLLHPPLRINEQLLRKHQVDEHEFWTVIHGNVYSIGPYMAFHPGGDEILIHYGERFPDVGFWFNKFHRWVSYEKLLQNCYVGKYVKET